MDERNLLPPGTIHSDAFTEKKNISPVPDRKLEEPVPSLEKKQDRVILRGQIINGELKGQTIESSVHDLIHDRELIEAIKKLRLKKDKTQGIKSYFGESNSGHIVLVRDATEQNQDTAPLDTYHDWAIIGISCVSAAKKLIEAYGITCDEESLEKLGQITEEFYQRIKKNKNKLENEVEVGDFIHVDLIPWMQTIFKKNKKNLTKKDIEKQLIRARDFCNFEYPTMSVATRIRIGEKDVFQIDIPLCGNMPDDLKDEYCQLRDNDPNIDNISWYCNQEPYIKYLMRKHAKDILNGGIIPTQLVKYFPGIRNGGEESIIDMNSESKEVLEQHYHTGTPGHLFLDAENNQTATNNSFKQLGNLTGAQHVLVLSLLSPLPKPMHTVMTPDADLVTQMQFAASACSKNSDTEFHVANIPINIGRRAIYNQLSGVEWLLDVSEQLQNKEYDAKLDKLIRKCKQLRNGANPFEFGNSNLKLVSVVHQIVFLVNKQYKILHPEETQDFIAIVSACKSGKDREGLARIKIIVDVLKKKFSSSLSAIKNAVMYAGQIPMQASLQGGTLGAGGIKNNSKSTLPSSWKKWEDTIFNDTASFNKKLPKNPNKQRRFYKNPYFILGVIGIVVGVALCATGVGALLGAPIAAIIIATLSTAVLQTGVTVGALMCVASAATLYFKKPLRENALAKQAQIFKRKKHKKIVFKQAKNQKKVEDKAQDRDESKVESKKVISESESKAEEIFIPNISRRNDQFWANFLAEKVFGSPSSKIPLSPERWKVLLGIALKGLPGRFEQFKRRNEAMSSEDIYYYVVFLQDSYFTKNFRKNFLNRMWTSEVKLLKETLEKCYGKKPEGRKEHINGLMARIERQLSALNPSASSAFPPVLGASSSSSPSAPAPTADNATTPKSGSSTK